MIKPTVIHLIKPRHMQEACSSLQLTASLGPCEGSVPDRQLRPLGAAAAVEGRRRRPGQTPGQPNGLSGDTAAVRVANTTSQFRATDRSASRRRRPARSHQTPRNGRRPTQLGRPGPDGQLVQTPFEGAPRSLSLVSPSRLRMEGLGSGYCASVTTVSSSALIW